MPAMVGSGGFGRIWDACDLLGQYRGATKPIRDAPASMPQLIFHGGMLPFEAVLCERARALRPRMLRD